MMRRLLLISLLACLSWWVAMDASAMALQVPFQNADRHLKLAQNAQVLEDVTGARTLALVQDDPRGWADHHADAFNFTFNHSAWWARVRLHNVEPREVTRILELGSALQDELDVYIVRAQREPIEHLATGDRRVFDARPVATRVPSVPLRFEAGESIDVYFKMATHDGLHEVVTPTLWEAKAYASSMQLDNLLHGLYFGALLTALVYHLFLFLSTRQLNFGLYVLFVGAFLVWSLTVKGYAFQYIWPDSPNFNNQILAISASTSYCCFALFMMGYFNTEHNMPKWMNKLILTAIVINALCIIPACLDHYALSFELNMPAGVILMLCSALVVSIMARRGSRPALYLGRSFLAMSLGVLLYNLRILGMVPSNAFSENGLLLGSGAQILLLAFGLADQMNQLKAGKLRAERAALAAQTALNIELESLVKRRTQALAAANQKFADTGLH